MFHYTLNLLIVKLMKGRTHSEEAVITGLMRKRIYYSHSGGHTREYGVLRRKTIVLSDQSDHIGIRTLGKLDFMRKKGWTVLDQRTSANGKMTEDEKSEIKRLAKEAKKNKIKLTTYK